MSLTSFFQKNKNEDSVSNPSYFYFYFPNDKKSDAEKLGDKMRSQGYDVKVHLIEDEANPNNEWSVVASRALAPGDIQKIDKVDNEMRNFAKEYGGDYDGHEVPVG